MNNSLLSSTVSSIENTPDGMPLDVNVEALLMLFATKLRNGDLKAFRHPVGFTLIDFSVLGNAPKKHQYRLHIWSADQYRSDGLGYIHDHSWYLTSAVLIGELVDTNFIALAGPLGRDYFARVKYGPTGESVEDVGRFKLVETRRRTLCAPIVYRLDAQVLHETRMLSQSAVTVVIADRSKLTDYRPLVSIQNSLNKIEAGPRQRLQADRVSNAISALAQAYSQSSRRHQ